MTPEAKVKKKVRETLKSLGAYYVMPVTSGYGSSGAPDFLVCWKGLFFGIECKAGKNTTTALQELNIKAIREAGGKAIVINEDNVDQLGSWMRAHEIINR
jgi:Holliday junction resolvase